MHGLRRSILAIVALALLYPCSSLAQSGTVEDIQIQGLRRMTPEAFLHAFGVAVGDPYDVERIRSRFKALWDLNLFEDLTIESDTGPQGGKALVVKVKERPVLTSVTYEEVSSVTRTEIEDRMRERGGGLRLGQPMDIGKVVFAEGIIRDLLGEKGFLDAEVNADVQRITETTRGIHFGITPGGKTRIRKIDFGGNELFSDRRLKSQLKLTQERKWYWPWSAKNLYHPAKWDQDVSAIRELYQNVGFLDVEIRAPVIEVVEKKSKKGAAKSAQEQASAPDETVVETTRPSPPPDDAVATAEGRELVIEDELTDKQRKKAARQTKKSEKKKRKKEKKAKKIKRWVYLTVSVSEGEKYTLGEVNFNGNDVFTDEQLRRRIVLREGAVFRNNFIDAGVKAITRMYEDRGHLYATVVRRILRREDENVADLQVEIDEDEPYYVARIEFSGNTATHDRVLRRELFLFEGELFNRTKLELSQRKLNQLGYWQAPDEPVIEPIAGKNRVNVHIAGIEQGRNEIQVGGGYSGLDGAFFNGVYSTRNFLGRGQTLSTALQVGGRANRYQISFQEPWFLGRPLLFGFSVFRRDIDFGTSLRSTSSGGGLIFGKRLTRFSNFNLSYNWESVQSTTFLTTSGSVDQLQTITSDVTVSSLTPFFSYNTINNPYRPTAGKQFSVSLQVAGGPLGGDTSFLKPIVRFIGYRRGFGRSYLGFHAQAGLIREFAGGGEFNDANASDIEGVPRFQRFWLGGDTLGPRAFETRSITPLRFVILDEEGRIKEVLADPRNLPADDFVTSGGVPVLIETGGDRFFLVQSELIYPLNQQAELAFFLDFGDTLFEDQSLGFDTTRVSAGVELRFHLPIFPVPLRLIYGIPLREVIGDDTSSFTFSIGRSF